MLSHQKGDPDEVLVENEVSVGAKPRDDAVDVDRVPEEHGIRQETKSTRLVPLLCRAHE